MVERFESMFVGELRPERGQRCAVSCVATASSTASDPYGSLFLGV